MEVIRVINKGDVKNYVRAVDITRSQCLDQAAV